MARLYLLLIIQIFSLTVHSQDHIQPAKGDTLNYTHVLFDIPFYSKAAKYEIVVRKDGKLPEAPIAARTTDTLNQFLVTSGLEFGNHYTWTYSCYDARGRKFYTSPSYQFHIKGSRWADTTNFKGRVTVAKNDKIQEGYIILDNGVITDRNGKAIWTFPYSYAEQEIRNLQLNYDGNLTFIDRRW